MSDTPTPVLHIHPTRMCNLTCAHCYSRSGPMARDHLALDTLLAGSAGLFQHGYRQASLSGGEPMLYRDVDGLCAGLTAQGYQVSVITNGWYCDHVQRLSANGYLHSVSISFDGLPCVHDVIRRRKGAFEKAHAGLKSLVAAGVETGAVIAVTRSSLPQLPDLVAVLRDAGAAQIQFHPVAAVGRATETPGHCAELNEEQMLRLLLLTEAFRKLYPETAFGTDALTGIDIANAKIGQPGSLISPLVVDETGRLHPYAYGMNPAHSLGSLQDGHAAPYITAPMARVIAATRTACQRKLASAFFPELVHQAQQPTL
ncbi:radical SAM protein [uncultured Tateyamaria sp.]|uniref:radical SAM protein n=1 Tax=uncultured Tateyamaria sp. TaxID=455651 RepID=UPI002632E243|nr:radical SAM protein [uncultured Tateyamaria sp.]